MGHRPEGRAERRTRWARSLPEAGPSGYDYAVITSHVAFARPSPEATEVIGFIKTGFCAINLGSFALADALPLSISITASQIKLVCWPPAILEPQIGAPKAQLEKG